MDHVLLPAQMRDGLVQYLGTRPYREVCDAIQALMALQPPAPAAAPTQPDQHMPTLGQNA